MKLQLRKRKQNNLRKLVKVDELGNSLSLDPMYVKIEEAENNVVQEGTAITLDVVDKVNWRDESYVEFTLLETNVLPSGKEGVVQLVAKQNGELWCVPPTEAAYALGNIDLSQYMTKSGKVYARGTSLEYFNLDKEAKIFSTRTRIGAIPTRIENEAVFNDGTYIECRNGVFDLYMSGAKVCEFTNDRMELKHMNAIFKIDSNGKINLEAPNSSSLNLRGGNIFMSTPNKFSLESNVLNLTGKFSLSSSYTSVEETADNYKFNCHTNLSEASYGNGYFRLQFYPDYVRIMDIRNPDSNRKVIQVNTDGTLLINDIVTPLTYPMGFSGRKTIDFNWGQIGKIGRYITDWKTASGGEILFREYNNKLYVGIDGEFYQNEGLYKVVDENSINSYIKSYLDNHFEEYYLSYLNKYESRKTIFSGCEREVYLTLLNSNKTYQLIFSLTSTSAENYVISFRGTDLQNSNPQVLDSEGNRYKVNQYIATDDQYDDYIEVNKYDSNNNYVSKVYIRQIYEMQ
ncbi:MAG: hypothetical protein K2I42_01255 [Anaeroplasmataceae bacterium]|nr:hypothetical protein [Anaeroplasmataceae bacterium]